MGSFAAKQNTYWRNYTESTREGLITCEVSILSRRSVHVGPMIKSEVALWFIILRRRMSPSAKTNNP